jgi:uncharacterized protein with von Willebrand factor type A (vWA) domain
MDGKPETVRELDAHLRALDDVPRSLRRAIIRCRHTQGRFQERCEGIVQWREALLAGCLPGAGTPWPDEPVLSRIREEFDRLGLARHCRGSEQRTDEILLSMITMLDQGEAEFPPHPVPENPDQSDEWTPEQEEERLQQVGNATAEAFRQQWQETAEAWEKLTNLFGDLGAQTGQDWRWAQGMVEVLGRGRGGGSHWGRLKQLQDFLSRSKQLREIIRRLGRMNDAPDGDGESIGDPTPKEVIRLVRRTVEEFVRRPDPRAVTDTRGIIRSNNVARMLPMESAMLGNPRLRLLWHARRTENQLISYKVSGTELVRTTREEMQKESATETERKPLERGPIILCLDTSGSMEGEPETVAKAMTFALLKVAHEEQRQCFVYAFAGSNEVREFELSMEPRSMERLLQFLNVPFTGGTDLEAPFTKALERLRRDDWKRADILLITDGDFHVEESLVRRVREARANLNLRCQGLLVGSPSDDAIRRICNPVHHYRSWAKR